MKTYLLIIVIFLLTIAASLYIFINPEENEIDSIITEETNWTEKQKEIISRLLSVPIMLYHDIDGKGSYSIDLDTLRTHFKLLKDNRVRVIPLSELVSRLNNPEPFNEKVMVITFDDGFLSAYTRLLPVVKEFGYPVTLFIYTNNIFVKAKKNITWDLLREMEKSGIEVECHSISHLDLEPISLENTAESKKKLFEEIYLSKRVVELYMGGKVKFFAFPYGRYNLNLVEMCRNSGYLKVFSTDSGSNIITRNNYCLRRGHIKRDFTIDFIRQKIK
jgi:peptidoglycan/xylan/chitin deacetylase (PgdA/CDA1 family)